VEGEKDEGTLSGKNYALFAMKQNMTVDARSTDGPLHRGVS